MTDGSSQGLFVIVAVVIFGIFVVISYMLFRDKLQTGLASIFDDSILETNLALGNQNILNNSNFSNNAQFWASSHKGTSSLVDSSDSSLPKLPNSSLEGNIIKITKNKSEPWSFLSQNQKNSKVSEFKIGDVITISAWVYIPEKFDDLRFSIGYFDKHETETNWIWEYTKKYNNISGSWKYITVTQTIKTENQKVFVVGYNNVTTDLTDVYFYCAGMKVEFGSVATAIVK